jgi:predicted ATPase
VDEILSDDAVIRTHDQRLRVFVSSTLGELAEERRAVARAISALRLTPVMFEMGARPHPPRDVYRSYLAQSDVFIGLYWQRYGEIAPGMTVSGLEDEFELSRNLPRLLYLKTPADGREPRLDDLLTRISGQVSYRLFNTPRELNRLVRDDLAALLSERFGAASPAQVVPLPARSPAAGWRGPRPLPVGTTSLIGREPDIAAVTGLVGRGGARLVTLTGPGGVGKTRLALVAGEQLRASFGAGTAYIPFAAVTEPDWVLAEIGRAVGADLGANGSRLEALIEHFGADRWLLILDNLEQVAAAATDLGALLARCGGLVILVTSRTALGLRAEREYPVLPLPLADDSATTPAAALASSPAVALFVDRARAVHSGFALTDTNLASVAEICRRLEGLPLAIELAAARTRLLPPAALLDRLVASLDALGAGAADLPERQRTLRATVEWSVGLLDEAERSLLEIAAVFADGWSLHAAAQVAGLDDRRLLELSESLVRHSMVQPDSTADEPRCRMLSTVREFIAERLAARPDFGQIQSRHADLYRSLAEQAGRQLRGPGHSEWLERLDTEQGNLAAAIRWYLAHDPTPLPHLFRLLGPLWFLRDTMGQGWSWIQQLLPAAGSLDLRAQAELAWTALVVDLEVGDDTGALAAREQLASLLTQVDEPFLHAVGKLAMAWSSPIAGDFDSAHSAASASLDQLRGLDEPFWTALAIGSLGSVETAVGCYGGALRHLHEMRNLTDRFGSAWLSAWSRVQLGTLSIARGKQGQAQALLDDALDLSLAARSTRSVSLCISAFARLAFANGDPERAALLAGATEGMRRPAGLKEWPTLRRADAELVAQIRQALGTDRFDEIFADGLLLNRHEAVAAARHPGWTDSQAS